MNALASAAARPASGPAAPPFGRFFLGGFECSTHRRRDGRRLDLIAATGHDRFARGDYAAARAAGLAAVRDGLRWHRIETAPGEYDWSSFLPMLRASVEEGVTVVWDLCHYGWPDSLDIWSGRFVDAFARFAAAAARLVRQAGAPAYYCPVNEISYWAWAGGEVAHFHPLAERRGDELKRQLVRASIAAIDAIRAEDPGARFVMADPVIHVAAGTPERRADAERARLAQFHAWDMLSGRAEPELGGGPRYLDLLGLNFYSDNQWYVGGSTIPPGAPAYRPLRELLAEVHARYRRPLLLAETGAEGELRVPWLRYVADEAAAALAAGVPLEGVCLYPILDYPGWADGRLCETGLFGGCDAGGTRPVHRPLAAELSRQEARLSALYGAARAGAA